MPFGISQITIFSKFKFIKKEIILMQEFLGIGQIVNTFGIKGMVKVKPLQMI